MTTEHMQKLKDRGLSYQEIGLKAGISRQRVHQLLKYDRETLNAIKRKQRRQARERANV